MSSFIFQLHEFVDGLCRYGEDPAYWPLSRDEQIAFCRSAIHQARQLAKSEVYLEQAVEIASQKQAEYNRRAAKAANMTVEEFERVINSGHV